MRKQPQTLFIDLEAQVRECGICHEVKPFSDFPDNKGKSGASKKGGPGGKQSYCRPCYRDYQREHASPVYKRHGLSGEEYDNLWERQNGLCAICKRDLSVRRGVNIDHDHSHCQGKYGCHVCVRSLLCPSCNMDLATLENTEWMSAAMEYLAKFETGAAY